MNRGGYPQVKLPHNNWEKLTITINHGEQLLEEDLDRYGVCVCVCVCVSGYACAYVVYMYVVLLCV